MKSVSANSESRSARIWSVIVHSTYSPIHLWFGISSTLGRIQYLIAGLLFMVVTFGFNNMLCHIIAPRGITLEEFALASTITTLLFMPIQLNIGIRRVADITRQTIWRYAYLWFVLFLNVVTLRSMWEHEILDDKLGLTTLTTLMAAMLALVLILTPGYKSVERVKRRLALHKRKSARRRKE